MSFTLPVKTKWMQTNMDHPPTREYAESLYNLSKKVQPKTALEVGCMWAVSTMSILLGSECHLTSVDLSEWTHAPEELELNGLIDRWKFINADSTNYWKSHEDKFDLIYIDGDHTYKYAHNDIHEGWKRVKDGGVLAIDDAIHQHNRSEEYGVAIATLEHLYNNHITEVNFEGKILWLRK